MKISQLLKNRDVTVSFEIFPPREWAKLEDTRKTVLELVRYKPDFISVTYGAGGGTGKFTLDLAEQINKDYGIPSLAHFTCVSSDRERVDATLAEMKARGIENILALRGDVPDNEDFVRKTDFMHASELMSYIKNSGDFCVGGACYPEGHPEAVSLEADIDTLRLKAEAGADFLTTQMFFDNSEFYAFRYRMLKKQIDIPVLAGIMPITNAKSVMKTVKLSGTILPSRFKAIIDRFGDNPAAMKQAGIAYATDQIIDLIANGAANIHIYTMNKPEIAGAIMTNLSDILK